MSSSGPPATFAITPDGPFSLDEAAAFGFGPRRGGRAPGGAGMRLAFVTDDLAHHAAARVTQDPDGTIRGRVETDGDPQAAWRQVLRVLSLDHAGTAWEQAGTRDPVLGQLQREHRGLRPVLFHSPYEAAAWAIISARRHRSTAAVIRERICDKLGRTFDEGEGEGGGEDAAGGELAAFPLPARLLAAPSLPSIAPQRVPWLHAVARAALDGDLDPARLAAMEPARALPRLQALPGIGPMYATLILLRSTGTADALTLTEPRLPSYIAHFYGLGPGPASPAQVARIAAGWRPFRTWGSVLIRVAGDRLNLPAAA
jgi:DNA-3-methyladenine glycosylase II